MRPPGVAGSGQSQNPHVGVLCPSTGLSWILSSVITQLSCRERERECVCVCVCVQSGRGVCVCVCVCVCLCVLVAQSCLTLCDPTDYSPPRSSVHGILQARIPEWMDCHSPLQRNFPIQGWNPGLLPRRHILYRLSYREISRVLCTYLIYFH